MAKKKMCKHWVENGAVMADTKKCWEGHYHRCPTNTNLSCEIIPKPAKVRRIKAWAIVRDLETGEIDGSFEAGNLPPKHFSSAYVPCTILINEKYLRGNK